MKKRLRYLLSISATSIVIALTITGLFAAYGSSPVHADASCIQYGAFLRSVSYIEAQQHGFFAKEGLNVCYNQVTSSTQQFNSLLSGQYDIIGTTADNVVNRYVNSQLPVEIVAGVDQGAGLDLIVNTANGIHTIADLKGKTVAVDAPNSGYVFALEKILAANGLSLANNDYSLQVIGGSAQRFAAISAGRTAAGDPVYATILGTPFSEQVPNVPTLSDIAKFSSYVAPYQGTTIATTQNYANNNSAVVSDFIAANILGQAFAANPANRATVLADIANVDNVSPAIAANIYSDSILDLSRGENIAALVNECGLVNTINLRQEFGGFTTTVDSQKLARPGKNSLYDDTYWKQAIAQLVK